MQNLKKLLYKFPFLVNEVNYLSILFCVFRMFFNYSLYILYIYLLTPKLNISEG